MMGEGSIFDPKFSKIPRNLRSWSVLFTLYPPRNEHQKHLKMDGWKTIVSFWGPAYFLGAKKVSFRECTSLRLEGDKKFHQFHFDFSNFFPLPKKFGKSQQPALHLLVPDLTEPSNGGVSFAAGCAQDVRRVWAESFVFRWRSLNVQVVVSNIC